MASVDGPDMEFRIDTEKRLSTVEEKVSNMQEDAKDDRKVNNRNAERLFKLGLVMIGGILTILTTLVAVLLRDWLA